MGELDQLKRRQILVATKASEKFMDLVLGAAQRIAPLEEGTLSGTADRETHIRPGGVDVVGYFSTIYAERRHEELVGPVSGEPVKFSVPGRQAKYLEAPFKQAAPRYDEVLAAALRSTIR